MQSGQIEGFRLSPQQKRTWLLQQEDATNAYCVQGAILIAGCLNLDVLREALQTTIVQYEIFRTTFQCLPGMTVPLQVIQAQSHVDMHEQDFTALSPQLQEVKLEELFDQLKHQSFASENSPPFSSQLLTLGPEKHILLVHMSPLLADGITLQQLISEINALYSGHLYSQTDEDEIMQYADIAEWQNELLEQEDYSIGKEYWQKQLTYDDSDLGLLSGNAHHKQRKFPIASVSMDIADNLAIRIGDLSHRLKIAIPELLLSCWQVLLWRLSGRQDLTVNIASNGRGHEELTTAPGPLSKYLPLTCQLNNALSFEEVLRKVNQSVHDAYEWQDEFTWEKGLVEGDPLSVRSFGFEFESWPDSYGEADISFSLYKRFVWREKIKLLLFCLQKGNSLAAEFYYDARLYGPDAIKELSTCFFTLLENAVNQAETPIGQLQLLDDDQQDKILRIFNQTQVDYPLDQCVHRLFEEQVQKTPDHIAVVSEEQQLTYGELNARANQLARYLKRLGVDNESLVGIYLERSVDVIVSLLATLKAGGAYVPLDPALPRENLVFRLQDTQMSVLLSQQHLTDALSDLETPLVCLDSQQGTIAEESQDNLDRNISVENLAYVLFTSGSTGKPKGVAVEHRQLLHYTSAIAHKLNLSICKSFATVSTFAADLGNTAIFPALLSGGCLHIISTERASNPETLADYFDHHAIDCLKIVPSHLAALLTSSRPEQILPKQCLILGGEACEWQLIEKIYSYGTDCRIFNHYGPTETTVGVLTYDITSERLNARPIDQTTVPIGQPIANTQIYLLDAEGQPVPVGVPGEIYIGGAGVARGYWNRTQLTEERFIPNSFIGNQPASPKLYKTGDRGRYQADGTVEFLGRIDYQVKIRGYRIELGEIESAIRQRPEIRETVVLARKGQSGNRRLVAYVVPEKKSDVAVSELREALKENLADYMVPAAFVVLKSLPLTPNGKVDRQALPAPEVQAERQVAFVAPGTDAEKALTEIWVQTLGIEKIGIHDNFFELGGDSILSIQIVARANQAGLKLTPKQVFENQTIAELATVATTQQATQAEQGPVVGDVPLTPIQQWFFDQHLPEAHHWNQSILLAVKQPLAMAQLEQAVQRLLEHHDALRSRFVNEDGEWQQRSLEPDGTVPLTHVDLSSVAEADQTRAISEAAAELQTSLNLSSGPLMRVAYFDLGADKSSRLLFIIHHLVVDGISWRVLLEDLQIAHQQISQGVAIQLPPKTTSFKYWAEQLAKYAQSDWQQQELDYWCRQSNQQLEPLPVDFFDNDNSVVKASTVSVALDEVETSALLQEVPAAYRTQINDVLLTALVQTFAQWTGERALLVDLEGHGREDIFENVDISRTVGWFTTIFPILLDLRQVSESSPGESLKAVKEQLRSVPNNGIGYGILRYLSTCTDWQPGSAEVRFNYLGQTDQVLSSSSIFAPARESVGPKRSSKGERSYRLDINSVVAGGRLQVDWTYSEAIHRRATVETLATGFIQTLRSLITHCQDPEAGGYTPSDFSEANLNQQELDQFLSKIQGNS